MDISKFNQELAYKVAKANGLEKHQRVEEAIKIWIEITEMVIKMSKLPKLDFSFRSMLIEKTEQIIKHIKDLKQISSRSIKNQSQEPVIKSPTKSTENLIEKVPSKNNESKIKLSPSIHKQNSHEISQTEKKTMKFIESDDIKNIPKGFKEIETSNDFTIITPHDKEYVEKILSQDIDMSIFKHQKSDIESITEQRAQNDRDNTDKLVCFACGIEVPLGTKNCPNCGTKLS
ncbi:MAG: zinc ribbon domain-containing protein [Promethearchaeota archaeon]|nr:MAG: zinc ribbon domain-containing protein [Candidatus Lokiarchaeota archaeon]